MNKQTSKETGFILLTLLITTTFIMMIGVVTLQLISSNLSKAKNEQYLVSAQLAADAGLDDAVRQLNNDFSWAGTGSEQTLYDSGNTHRTTYQTWVNAGSDDLQKFISVTAKTYAPASSTNAKFTRNFTVEMRGVTAGNYSVVTGVGGLVMSNSSKIVGGNVYVNGSITMSNSAQIGLTTNPVNVKAAHQNCPVPAGATYPQVCGASENGQPINFSNTAKIYGEVQATNQTDGSSMSLPGLVAGSPPPAALPSHDRTAQVGNVVSTYTGNFTCNSGSHSWPANYKINGDVTIKNTCEVTVNGDVWITGKLTMENSGKLIVSNTVGATQPVIMVDGQNVVLKNSAVLQSNSQSTGFRVITYWSKAGCSPGCANVTGASLYDSRDETTIELDNSASGPNTEFYARWTQITIANSGNIGALVGQTIQLKNSGAITFGTSINGVGGIEAYVIKSYKRTF